jgi:hypothetical protein
MAVRTFGRKIRWRVYIPEELALEIEVAMFDKMTGKPVYGGRSQLVTVLLQNHLQELKLKGALENNGR